MSEGSSKRKDKRRSSRLPAGTAGLMSTLGEKGRGYSVKPIIIILLSTLLIVASILIIILRV